MATIVPARRRSRLNRYRSPNRIGLLHPRLTASLMALAALLCLVVACSPNGPATVNVAVKNFKYAPDPITIGVGDSITWTNEDPVGHTATADDDSFNTRMVFPDDSAAITFDVAGTFPYFCGAHPEMTGTVVVERSG